MIRVAQLPDARAGRDPDRLPAPTSMGERPDPVYGEVPVAVVSFGAAVGCTVEELREQLARSLAKIQVAGDDLAGARASEESRRQDRQTGIAP
jgi:hypothetical protein